MDAKDTVSNQIKEDFINRVLIMVEHALGRDSNGAVVETVTMASS